MVSGHTLGELPSAHLRSFAVGALWRKAKDYLVRPDRSLRMFILVPSFGFIGVVLGAD